MDTRLINVVVDALRPQAQARFWATLLDWRISADEPGEIEVRAPAGDAWDLDLLFIEVPDPKTTKNRVHLDLASRSPEHQAELVERALRLGARHVDLGQGDVPWVVLADPEGNEFCVLDPHPRYTSGAVAAIVVDSHDPAALGRFWTRATGWPVDVTKDHVVALRSPDGLWLEFLRGGDEKKGKNRFHLDVAPFADGDQATAVAELREAGAESADVGQGDVPWKVMTDPEGNEFCVLTPR